MKEKRFILGNLFKKEKEEEINSIYNTKRIEVKPLERKDTSINVHTDYNAGANEKAEHLPKVKKNEGDFLKTKIDTEEKTEDIFVDEEKSKVSVFGKKEKEDKAFKAVKYVPYKSIVKRKLVVILLEESALMNGYSDVIQKIILKIPDDDVLCIIRYGENVKNIKTDVKECFTLEDFSVKVDSTNYKKTLYDAIKEAYVKIKQFSFMRIEKEEFIIRIDMENIEFIGFGTCIDNSSSISFEDVNRYFNDILNKGIKTKYFCINETYMPYAASFGFRSIGSLTIDY